MALETRTFEAETRTFRYARLLYEDYCQMIERVRATPDDAHGASVEHTMALAVLAAVNRVEPNVTVKDLCVSVTPPEMGRFYREVMEFTGIDPKVKGPQQGEPQSP